MGTVLRNGIFPLKKNQRFMLSDVCTNDISKLWKNGTVPIVFNDNVNGKLRDSVIEAMNNITTKSAIEFLEITNPTNEVSHVEIIEGGEFASYVGMQGGKQKLLVAEGSLYPVGHVMHELMHVLGLFHEHSRPDRDIYFNVNDEAANNANYRKLSESNSVCYSKTPDYQSIMLYCEDGIMTLKKRINFKIGQREKLSDGDIYALNNLYPPEEILRSRSQALGDEILEVKNKLDRLSANNNDKRENLRLKSEYQKLLKRKTNCNKKLVIHMISLYERSSY